MSCVPRGGARRSSLSRSDGDGPSCHVAGPSVPRFRGGRLPIPADWVLDHAQKNATQYIPRDLRNLPETREIFAAFTGSQPARSTTVINLGDGRSVRILSLASLDGKLRITCQTELADPRAAAEP